MIQVLFPSWCSRNMIKQLRINQISSWVTLDGTNMQDVVVRVYAILKSGFVASSVEITHPLTI